MKLWLDDIRTPPAEEGWEWYTSPWKALDFVLRMGEDIDEWSLDHDLGDGIPTGYDFLLMIELLLAQGLKIPVPDKVNIHSSNPAGKKNMQSALISIGNFLSGC